MDICIPMLFKFWNLTYLEVTEPEFKIVNRLSLFKSAKKLNINNPYQIIILI